MSSPERLNVLLSRARNGLVIIGNSETFLKSRTGKEIWTRFFDMIKRLGYFYEGLPVRCEQHNDTKNILRLPEDFERLCPDGGCSELWFVPSSIDSPLCLNPWLYSGNMMNCGIHTCPRKCHTPQDHKVLKCTWKMRLELPCGHRVSLGCHQSKTPDACFACKLAKRKAEADNAAGGNETEVSDRSSASADSRSPTPLKSPTFSWRDRRTTTTTDSGSWRGGQRAGHSTGVFDKYVGSKNWDSSHR